MVYSHVNTGNNAYLRLTDSQIRASSLTPLSTGEVAWAQQGAVGTVLSDRGNIKRKMRSNAGHEVVD